MIASRRRGSILLLLLLGVSLIAAHRPGEAQTAIETGWWWKGNPGEAAPVPSAVPGVPLPAAPPGLPAPPNVNGGLMIAALPDGAFSIAAIKAEVDAQSITLTPVENGDVGGVNAHLLACATSGDWVAEAGGRWDSKPVVACDLSNAGGSVAGIRGDDGSWVFPVQPLVEDGAIDVVIVPATGPLPAGLLEPFQLVFKVPTIASFVVNPPAPAVVEVGGPIESPSADTSTEDFGSGTDGSFDADAIVGDGSFAPVASPALPMVDQAPRLITPVGATATDPANSGAQAVGLLMLLLAGGALWMSSRQALPAPVSLTRVGARPRTGAVAPPTVGGLGRFERTRSGRPPSLF